jgi:hypothetical protein
MISLERGKKRNLSEKLNSENKLDSIDVGFLRGAAPV